MIEHIQAWKTSDGKIFVDEEEAQSYEERLKQIKILSDIEVYWRDTGPGDVAEALRNQGFVIMRREIVEEMARVLNDVRVQAFVARLKEEGKL